VVRGRTEIEGRDNVYSVAVWTCWACWRGDGSHAARGMGDAGRLVGRPKQGEGDPKGIKAAVTSRGEKWSFRRSRRWDSVTVTRFRDREEMRAEE
jgi:hypothetical protein